MVLKTIQRKVQFNLNKFLYFFISTYNFSSVRLITFALQVKTDIILLGPLKFVAGLI